MSKYKLVVVTRYKTYVKQRSKNRELLEDIAVKLSLKHPTWKFKVLSEDSYI